MMTDALQKRGLRVVGVDASAAMLARARARLGESTVLIQQRLPDLSVDGVFDAAVSTFDGLNYLSPADFSSAISALRDKLRPGGWLAFDLHTSAMMEFTRLNPIVRGEIDGMRFVISSEVDVDSRTCDSRIDLTRVCDGDAFSECHRQYFVTDAEVGAALDDAGLLVVGVGDEYTHTQVDAATLRATWVARNRGGTAGDEHG
jgi:SAM-dependent methyltransferase